MFELFYLGIPAIIGLVISLIVSRLLKNRLKQGLGAGIAIIVFIESTIVFFLLFLFVWFWPGQ